MKKLLIAASIVALSSGAALAESAKSTTDKPAAAGQGSQTEKQMPGTTGAMQNSAGGVATTPDDVKKQGGMGVGAEGNSGKAGKEMGGSGAEKPK